MGLLLWHITYATEEEERATGKRSREASGLANSSTETPTKKTRNKAYGNTPRRSIAFLANGVPNEIRPRIPQQKHISRAYTTEASYTLELAGGRTSSYNIYPRHQALRDRLRNINRRKPTILRERNLAIANFTFVTEQDTDIKEISAPHNTIYVSGSDTIPTPIAVDGVNYSFQCFGDLIEDQNTLDLMRKFVSNLMHAARDETTLDPRSINATVRQLGVSRQDLSTRGSPKKLPRPPVLNTSKKRMCIPEYYCHSEQVLAYNLLYHLETLLTDSLDTLEHAKRLSPDTKMIIHQFCLEICSSNEVCRKCANALYRVGENAGNNGLLTQLNTLLRKRGYIVPPEGVHFFVTASGLKHFDSPPQKKLVAETFHAPFPVNINEHRVLQIRAKWSDMTSKQKSPTKKTIRGKNRETLSPKNIRSQPMRISKHRSLVHP